MNEVDLEELLKMQQALMKQSDLRKTILSSKGIFIDIPAPTNYQGKSLWAIGTRIYYYPKENITFHEAMFYLLSLELGKEWIDKQESLPLEERHFILKCHHAYIQMRKGKTGISTKEGSDRWSTVPDGLTKSLMSLAFDIACIIHRHGYVPEKMIQRLKLTDSNYQGARYEIAVSAIFARLGCRFEFLDEKLDGLTQTPGHCEFLQHMVNQTRQLL